MGRHMMAHGCRHRGRRRRKISLMAVTVALQPFCTSPTRLNDGSRHRGLEHAHLFGRGCSCGMGLNDLGFRK